jgi:hypothetical protein
LSLTGQNQQWENEMVGHDEIDCSALGARIRNSCVSRAKDA